MQWWGSIAVVAAAFTLAISVLVVLSGFFQSRQFRKRYGGPLIHLESGHEAS
jgi:hypothetical protein